MSWTAEALGIDLDALKRERFGLDDDWIGTARAANRYYVSTETIYRYARTGKISSKKEFGRLWVSNYDLSRIFSDTPRDTK
jgi:hypothetical protein